MDLRGVSCLAFERVWHAGDIGHSRVTTEFPPCLAARWPRTSEDDALRARGSQSIRYLSCFRCLRARPVSYTVPEVAVLLSYGASLPVTSCSSLEGGKLRSAAHECAVF